MQINKLIEESLFANNSYSKRVEKITSSCISGGKKVLFFGRFTTPTSSAGACRTLYISKMFRMLGYQTYISGFTNEQSLGFYKYGEVYLLPYAFEPKTFKEKFHLFLNSKKEIKEILSKFDSSKPDIVVIYSVLPIPTIRFLIKYSKANKIRLIFDVVESQIISQQSLGSFFAYYLPQRYIDFFAVKKGASVISISTYLHNRFTKRGIKSVFIPFVNDTNSTPDFAEIEKRYKKNTDTKYILYAGNPRHKRDLLWPIFKAVQMMDDTDRKKIRILISGVDANQLIKNEGVTKEDLNKTSNEITVLGRLPHSTIESLYRVCDFSILVKPLKKRFSIAGFPTKVSESMAHGVPPICNLSSDLALYLNSNNSVLINGDRITDIKEALNHVAHLSDKEIYLLRCAARETSRTSLDVETFLNEFSVFLK
jgi:glycosyltransferase involved in cell wall biosynthesis